MTTPRKGCQEDSDNYNHRRRNLLTKGVGLFGLVDTLFRIRNPSRCS